MACWSAENATKAYLKTLKMGHRSKGLDIAEFISALAAGRNAQLMVVASANPSYSILLALAAAAHQTGGRVVCIVRHVDEIDMASRNLGQDACHIEFVNGNAKCLISTEFREADFVLIDCKNVNHEEIYKAMEVGRKKNGAVVVGYNAASCKGSWGSLGRKTQLLPIGGGLLVTRIPSNVQSGHRINFRQKGQWIVKVDKCTGEEHVFRVRFPQPRGIET